MKPVESRDRPDFGAMTAGVRYASLLARYPERPLEPRACACTRALAQALRRVGLRLAGKRRADAAAADRG